MPNKYEKELALMQHEYNQKRESIQNDYNTLFSKIPEVVDKCFQELSEKANMLEEKIKSLEETLSDEKYNFSLIKNYEPEQLECIAEILDLGRADSFKEALNLFLNEKNEMEYRQKMLERADNLAEIQKEANEQTEWQRNQAKINEREERRIAQQRQMNEQQRRRNEQHRHNEEIESNARAQTEQLKKQTELAERQAEQSRMLAKKQL